MIKSSSPAVDRTLSYSVTAFEADRVSVYNQAGPLAVCRFAAKTASGTLIYPDSVATSDLLEMAPQRILQPYEGDSSPALGCFNTSTRDPYVTVDLGEEADLTTLTLTSCESAYLISVAYVRYTVFSMHAASARPRQ